MPLCWHCNTRVQFLEDGWKCPCCGQHGAPDLIADSLEDATTLNAPYIDRRPHAGPKRSP